jgi:hypothetical protein
VPVSTVCGSATFWASSVMASTSRAADASRRRDSRGSSP